MAMVLHRAPGTMPLLERLQAGGTRKLEKGTPLKLGRLSEAASPDT